MRAFLSIVLLLAGCSELPTASNVDNPIDAGDGVDMGDGSDAGETFAATQVVFDFGDYEIPAGGERYPCAVWTLNNEKPLYVNAVVQANDGGFHHSNWYAVRDDQFIGEDGYFTCSERGFQEATGAVFGEVVFAQSTQAYVEEQRFPEGVAIKIPPHSKIIGGVHLLNVSASPLNTGVRMGLELLHPRDVETVATPWRMDNSSLAIPGETHSRWVSECNLKTQYENKTGEPFEPLMYWLLPHYHALGDYFRVDLIRPEGDETIIELSGFNAEANGVTFAEPVDLTGVTGMRMVCGYTNPFGRLIFYGTAGDDEMCTLLAFTNAAMRLNTEARSEESMDPTGEDGFETHYADCSSLFIPKNDGQAMPTEEEIDAELYVPESNSDGNNVALVPECEDTPEDAEPSGPITLSSLRTDLFMPSCAFSACHDADAPAAGLDFTADDLHRELLDHELLAATDSPLVAIGDASNSWLFQVMSTCEPESDTGVVSAMPRNAPRLLPQGEVARVRAWIDAGALND